MRGGCTGIAIDQRIWTTGGLVSMKDLYDAFVDGNIGNYQIYYVDPQSINDSVDENVLKPLVGTMSVIEVFDQSVHQAVTLTSEDGLTVTVGSGSFILDISDFYPTHVIAKPASELKHYISATSGLGGSPGDTMFVRNITGYRMTGSRNLATLPMPNVITENGFVVMC